MAAGSTVARARVILEADDRGLKSGLKSAETTFDKSTGKMGRNLDDLEKKNHRVSKALGTALKAGALVGVAALGGLAVGAKKAWDELLEGQKVAAQTRAVLKSTGGAANVTAKQIDQLAGSILRKTGIDDEAIKSGQNLLLTFTNVRNEAGKGNDIFTQSTRIMVDMSVALGQDMKSSAIQLGKALQDPIRGITALRRVGIDTESANIRLAKRLAETGNVLGAQKAILRELNVEFGGSAKAAGETLPGQFNILKETAKNMGAELLTGVLPAVTKVTQGFLDALPKIQQFVRELIDKVKPAIQAVVDVVRRQWPTIQRIFNQVVDFVRTEVVPIFVELGRIVGDMFVEIGRVIQRNRPQLEAIGRDLAVIFRNIGTVLREVVLPAVRFVFTEVLPRAIAAFILILRGATTVIKGIAVVWRTAWTTAATGFNAIRTAASGAASFVKTTWQGVTNFFGPGSALRRTISGIGGVFTTLKSSILTAIGAVLTAISGFLGGLEQVFRAAGKLPGVGGKFRGIADDIKGARTSVDRLRDGITRLQSKKVTVKVDYHATQRGGTDPRRGDGIVSTSDRMGEGAIGTSRDRDAQQVGAFPQGFQGTNQAGSTRTLATIDRWVRQDAQEAANAHFLANQPVGGPVGRNPGGLVWDILDELGLAQSLGLRLTSGYDPGRPPTSTGGVSLHKTGQAIDMAGAPASMARFARAAAGRPGVVEVIYTPVGSWYPGSGWGRPSGQLAADHYDHVHVGVRGGGQTGVVGAPGRGRYNLAQLRSLSAQHRFPNPRLAAAIAMAESGGSPSATNYNTNGSVDRGLWQINSIHRQFNGQRLFEPNYNATAAYRISSGGSNWRPWVVYNTGAYRRYMGDGLVGRRQPGTGGPMIEDQPIIKTLPGIPLPPTTSLYPEKTPVPGYVVVPPPPTSAGKIPVPIYDPTLSKYPQPPPKPEPEPFVGDPRGDTDPRGDDFGGGGGDFGDVELEPDGSVPVTVVDPETPFEVEPSEPPPPPGPTAEEIEAMIQERLRSEKQAVMNARYGFFREFAPNIFHGGGQGLELGSAPLGTGTPTSGTTIVNNFVNPPPDQFAFLRAQEFAAKAALP